MTLEFVNYEPRCACVLVLDTSHSMSGDSINELNQALKAFEQDLKTDSLASKRVDVSIVTFGPVHLHLDFVNAEQFVSPVLQTTGDTPMGEALTLAINRLEQRKQSYKINGIPYYRPWMILITDGAPTDDVSYAATTIQALEHNQGVAFFALGVKNADLNRLATISVRPPRKITDHHFREFFLWLSTSLKSVSQSTPGEQVKLPPISGWTSV